MKIIGSDAVVSGVNERTSCMQYLTDYGLEPIGVTQEGDRFEALDGLRWYCDRISLPLRPSRSGGGVDLVSCRGAYGGAGHGQGSNAERHHIGGRCGDQGGQPNQASGRHGFAAGSHVPGEHAGGAFFTARCNTRHAAST